MSNKPPNAKTHMTMRQRILKRWLYHYGFRFTEDVADMLILDAEAGDLACGEEGEGRMAEPAQILAAIEQALPGERPLGGKRALVTSGPTQEAIDPVRYISNRSSGKQGHAIAAACARLGAEVTLVSAPTGQPDPASEVGRQSRPLTITRTLGAPADAPRGRDAHTDSEEQDHRSDHPEPDD